MQPLFVTLDPARDTPPILKAYVTGLDPRMLGLYGSPAQTRQVAGLYKTFYEKVPASRPGSYYVDHSAWIYLLDRHGRHVAFFPPGTPAERMEVMVREVLSGERVAVTPSQGANP